MPERSRRRAGLAATPAAAAGSPGGIPERDLTWHSVQASGPGGQNVNKVASAVQLRFDLSGTRLLEPAAKARLRSLAGRRATASGELVLTAREHRTREANRRAALMRLAALIERARHPPAPRRPGRVPERSRRERLQDKRRRQGTKRLRARVHEE